MKKFISGLGSYLGHVGAYFMFTMLVFGVASKISLGTTVNLVLIWTSLLFAAMTGLADLIFRIRSLTSLFVKVLLHGIATVASFAVAFVLCSNVVERGKTALFGVLLFALLYIVLATIACVYRALAERKANGEASYQSIYTPKN